MQESPLTCYKGIVTLAIPTSDRRDGSNQTNNALFQSNLNEPQKRILQTFELGSLLLLLRHRSHSVVCKVRYSKLNVLLLQSKAIQASSDKAQYIYKKSFNDCVLYPRFNNLKNRQNNLFRNTEILKHDNVKLRIKIAIFLFPCLINI